MRKYSISLSILFAVIISGCGKDYNPGGVVTNNNNLAAGTYNLQSAFAEVAVQSKIVTLDASTGGTFTGNSGSRYIIPANAFKNSAGAVVTGNMQLEVKEYLKKSDMLFSGVMPVSSTDPLISGGETYVNATQDGQTLSMAGTSKYRVNMPQNGTPEPGMQLFTGQTDPTTNSVVWSPNQDSTGGTVTYNGDTTSILSNTLNFVNADHFLGTGVTWQSFTINCSAADAVLTDTLAAFALFDHYTSVYPMATVVKGVINETHTPNMPIHFVVIAIIKGNFYAGMLGATPSTGSNYKVVLTKTTPSQFKKEIDAL